MGSDRIHVATHVPEEQNERWEAHFEDMGFRSKSAWVEAMVEAGLKKFDAASVEPDETNRELREQRNDLKTELDRARNRIQELEDAVYHGERQAIKEFVEENPGAEFADIVRHIEENAPSRVRRYLDDLEGDAFRVDDEERYYLRDDAATDGGWLE